MELLGYNTTDDEGNEVSLNQNDLERSLMRNWKNFRETFKQRRIQQGFFRSAERSKAMQSAL